MDVFMSFRELHHIFKGVLHEVIPTEDVASETAKASHASKRTHNLVHLLERIHISSVNVHLLLVSSAASASTHLTILITKQNYQYLYARQALENSKSQIHRLSQSQVFKQPSKPYRIPYDVIQMSSATEIDKEQKYSGQQGSIVKLFDFGSLNMAQASFFELILDIFRP